jgi:hypothetical protein
MASKFFFPGFGFQTVGAVDFTGEKIFVIL